MIQSINKTIKNYKKLEKKTISNESNFNSRNGFEYLNEWCDFYKDRENATNYYSINYDDITGLTNTVTSGYGEYSNKTIFIYRSADKQLRSPRFKN